MNACQQTEQAQPIQHGLKGRNGPLDTLAAQRRSIYGKRCRKCRAKPFLNRGGRGIFFQDEINLVYAVGFSEELLGCREVHLTTAW
jgi:hypothetical protein